MRIVSLGSIYYHTQLIRLAIQRFRYQTWCGTLSRVSRQLTEFRDGNDLTVVISIKSSSDQVVHRHSGVVWICLDLGNPNDLRTALHKAWLIVH